MVNLVCCTRDNEFDLCTVSFFQQHLSYAGTSKKKQQPENLSSLSLSIHEDYETKKVKKRKKALKSFRMWALKGGRCEGNQRRTMDLLAQDSLVISSRA